MGDEIWKVLKIYPIKFIWTKAQLKTKISERKQISIWKWAPILTFPKSIFNMVKVFFKKNNLTLLLDVTNCLSNEKVLMKR